MTETRATNPKADPWYKTTLRATLLGKPFRFHVPHDVFANTGVDEGTVLLLEHLPANAPRSVLDLGCGYGALGLPIAARYPEAKLELVDRDLLPAHWAALNAKDNGLSNVEVRGSLGFRDLDRAARYDWILCNVPARIGRPFIEFLLAAGRERLTTTGELRIVVIRDLAPLIEELGAHHKWPITETVRGPRHVVYALSAGQAPDTSPESGLPREPDNLYARDLVEADGLKLERPYDLRGDDPRLLAAGLPLLLDSLPRTAPGSVLCFRASYGVLPLTARTRWPEARIATIDRDLLMTAFTRRNAERLGLGGARLTVRESACFPDALATDERFDLAIGELSPATGERAAATEIDALAGALSRGGQALILTLDKLERDWIRPLSVAKSRLSIARLAAREGYAILRVANR